MYKRNHEYVVASSSLTRLKFKPPDLCNLGYLRHSRNTLTSTLLYSEILIEHLSHHAHNNLLKTILDRYIKASIRKHDFLPRAYIKPSSEKSRNPNHALARKRISNRRPNQCRIAKLALLMLGMSPVMALGFTAEVLRYQISKT